MDDIIGGAWVLKKVVIALLVIVLLAGGGFAGWYLLKETPKVKYFSAEKKALEDFQKELTTVIEKEFESFKSNSGKSFENKLTVGASVDGKVSGEELPKEVVKTIESLSIDLENAYNYKEKEFYDNIAVNFNNEEFLKVQLLTKENKLTAFIPILHEKAFEIDGNKIGEIGKRFDETYEGPETIDFASAYQTFTYDELKKYYSSLEKYAKYIFDNVKDEQITESEFNKNVNGVDVKGESLTLTLNEEETKALLIGLADTFKNDKELLNMIVDDATRSAQLEGISKEEIKKEIEESIEEFKKEIEESFKAKVVSQIVLDKKGNIIHRDFKIENLENNKSGSILWTKTENGGVFALQDAKTKEIVLKDEYTKEYKENSFNVVHTITIDEIEPFTISYSRDVKGDNVKDELKLELKVPTYDSETEIILYIKGDNNYNGSKIEGTIGIGLIVKDEFNDIKGELNIDVTSEFKDEVKVKNVDAEETNVIHELSEEELGELFFEIQGNIEPLIHGLGTLSYMMY